MKKTCAVCGKRSRLFSHFCSSRCEEWIIDRHRSSLLTELVTNMNGRSIRMRGEQVLLWR